MSASRSSEGILPSLSPLLKSTRRGSVIPEVLPRARRTEVVGVTRPMCSHPVSVARHGVQIDRRIAVPFELVRRLSERLPRPLPEVLDGGDPLRAGMWRLQVHVEVGRATRVHLVATVGRSLPDHAVL